MKVEGDECGFTDADPPVQVEPSPRNWAWIHFVANWIVEPFLALVGLAGVACGLWVLAKMFFRNL